MMNIVHHKQTALNGYIEKCVLSVDDTYVRRGKYWSFNRPIIRLADFYGNPIFDMTKWNVVHYATGMCIWSVGTIKEASALIKYMDATCPIDEEDPNVMLKEHHSKVKQAFIIWKEKQ